MPNVMIGLRMGSEAVPLEVDLTGLRVLAHPLRVRLVELIDQEGAATSTRLAELTGENTGTLSYHLRQLARHGFIEEDRDRGTQRERWWRVRPGGFKLEGWRFLDDPSSASDVMLIAREMVRSYAEELHQWLSSSQQWATDWIQATTNSSRRFDGTAKELAALRDEVLAVIDRHVEEAQAQRGSAEAARLIVHFHAFPSRSAD